MTMSIKMANTFVITIKIKVKVKTILTSGLYHLLKEKHMKNHVSERLQKQLQTAFVKSGMTTKEFFHFILDKRKAVVFDWVEKEDYVHFHTICRAHDTDEMKTVTMFYCSNGSEWGCKF